MGVAWVALDYVHSRAAMTRLGMSARAFRRILKLVRTIADLEGVPDIETHHLAEAIQYRPRRQV
jgi:magnesium chelatase family protein